MQAHRKDSVPIKKLHPYEVDYRPVAVSLLHTGSGEGLHSRTPGSAKHHLAASLLGALIVHVYACTYSICNCFGITSRTPFVCSCPLIFGRVPLNQV